MSKLTAWGVTVLVGDDIYKQHQPGTGDNCIPLFPWHLAWQALLQHPWLDLDLVKGERHSRSLDQ
jgi:UDP-N-acetyl-D-mannosaminuronate dehydrogenase